MAALRDEAAEEDGQSCKRELTPIDGRLTVGDQNDLQHLVELLPRRSYVELTHLVLASISLEHIPTDLCALPNLTRLGAIHGTEEALIIFFFFRLLGEQAYSDTA